MAQTDVNAELFVELGLDWARLTGALKGGNAAGEDIRYTPEFDVLARARVEEDDTDQGIWQVEAKKADWRAVADQACDLLANRSKDLQVAVWLSQALYHLHGLKGMAAGVAIVARLTKSLWPVLWPQPDGDDLESRMAPYFWLDTRLVSQLSMLEIAEPEPGEERGFTYQRLIKARDLERTAKNRPKLFEQALAEGEIPLDRLMRAVNRSGTEFLVERWRSARMTLAALKKLGEALDAAAVKDAPSYSAARDILNDLDRLFKRALADRQVEPADSPPRTAPQDTEKGRKVSASTSSQAPASLGPGGSLAIKDRRMAYALLEQVANWLLAHEPHSPAPFLVKRAVSWESMSLGDVLTDLMASGTDINTTLKVLGITSDDGDGQTRRRGAQNLEDL